MAGSWPSSNRNQAECHRPNREITKGRSGYGVAAISAEYTHSTYGGVINTPAPDLGERLGSGTPVRPRSGQAPEPRQGRIPAPSFSEVPQLMLCTIRGIRCPCHLAQGLGSTRAYAFAGGQSGTRPRLRATLCAWTVLPRNSLASSEVASHRMTVAGTSGGALP